MKGVEGAIPEAAQRTLSPAKREQGYLLACSCYPTGELTVALPSTTQTRIPAVVTGQRALTERIVEIRLQPESPFAYQPGQFVNLWRDANLGRSYSLASVPGIEEALILHVGRIPGGVMSNWIHDQLREGDYVELQGPEGECYYLPGDQDQPLLLAGTGTGLAPLYGIAREALRQEHRGIIHLFHGGRDAQGLYLMEELEALAAQHPNFNYHPCALDVAGLEVGRAVEGALDLLIKEAFPNLKGWRAYLCGAPDMVQLLRKQTFLAGASSKDILADAFGRL